MTAETDWKLVIHGGAGIIERERRGKYAYFSVAPGALQRVGELLSPSAAVA